LQEANSYKGGLNRANIMVAARSIDQTNPLYINGLTTKMNGTKDAYLSEGGRMVKYTVTDPKQFGTFQPAGDLINLEGQLGTLAEPVRGAQHLAVGLAQRAVGHQRGQRGHRPGGPHTSLQLQQLRGPLDVGQRASPELEVELRVLAGGDALALDPRLDAADLP